MTSSRIRSSGVLIVKASTTDIARKALRAHLG
jgi:hypothetical protein